MSASVFVTGASGRVGLPLVRALVARGHEVTGLARSEAKAAVVRNAGARCVVGSLADTAAVREAARSARVVFHLAGGLRGPGRVSADLVNRQGALDLLAAVGTLDLDQIVFTSTCAVYGDRSDLWVEESYAPHPQTLYAASKLAAERVLLDGPLPVRVVRLAAVYGPGFPYLMADRIRAGRGWLPGEGTNYVPTIHIDDAVAGLIRIQERGDDNEIYNLADPGPVTTGQFYGAVHERVGGRPMRFWSTWIPSYVQFWAADHLERAAARLGRTPRVTPDQLRLFTASCRMRVSRMQDELGFEWRHPDPIAGVASCLP